MSSFFYFLKEALLGFARNLSTTLGSIVTIFLSLFIIGVFIVFGGIVDNIVTDVEDQVSLTVYVDDEASDRDITTLQNFIEGLDGVAAVGFTDKEQALENFKNTNAANPDIVDQLDGMNPLPASIDVELSDPQMVSQVADAIKGNSTFLKICEDSDNPSASLKYGESTVDRLFSMTNYIRYVGVALIILLIFVAMVFINNTIRLAILARRKEIGIMRLVGASNGFIRGPFLMEGALHALIGALLAVLTLELLRNFVLPSVSGTLMWLPINLDFQVFLFVYVILIIAGLVIGLIGSAFAMRRYLKV